MFFRFSEPLPMFVLKRPKRKYENIDMMTIEYCTLYVYLFVFEYALNIKKAK